MKLKILLVSLALLLSASLIAVGCAPTPTPPTPTPPTPPTPTPPTPPAEKITWQIQNNYGYGIWHELGGVSVYLADKVKRITGGRFEIKVAAPGAIVGAGDIFAAVSRGTIDGCLDYWPGFHEGLMPEVNVQCGLPYAWPLQWEATDAFMNYGLLEITRELYAKHDIYYLAPTPNECTYAIMTTFPISCPTDLAGKKIRATGVYGDFVKAFGGSPTVIPWGEMYMALALGTVDGAIMGPGALETEKLKEVITHAVITPNLNCTVSCMIVNKKSWNALPADLKVLLEELALDVGVFYQTMYATQERHILLDVTKTHGIELVTFTGEARYKAIAAGVDIWDKVAAMSPVCAEMVNIVKQQARDLGKID